MAMQGMGATNLSIGDLSHGIDANGMVNYAAELRLSILDETITKLQDDQQLVDAVNNCWQGLARDRFLWTLQEQQVKIAEDLRKEQTDLEARLRELAGNYYTQDIKMLDE